MLPDKPIDIAVLRQKLRLYLGSKREAAVLNVDLSTLSPPIAKIINIINENPFRFKTVRDIANSIPINPDYLSAMFKKETGVYLHYYLVAPRIAKAMELLSGGVCNIKEISYNLGFSSQHSFYKAFKKVANLSPSEYRMAVCKGRV